MTATEAAPTLAISNDHAAKFLDNARILGLSADAYMGLLLENDQWRIDIEEKMVEIEATIKRENLPEHLAEHIRQMNRRTPIEIAEANARMDARSRPAITLPPGMTPDDLVKGLWDGDETDEELEAIIKDLKR